MLIDKQHRFLSQRQLPKMALINTQLTATELILSTSSSNTISVPINPDDGDICNTNIWNQSCIAKTTSKQADQWLSDFLDIQCQLVYQPNNTNRPVDPTYSKATDQINFSDGFPFLIVSEASLTNLNQAMELNFGIERFRPNLVIAQCDAYAEDSWREININNIDFRLPKPCSRCAVPTINPKTAEKGKEPLSTLNRLRKWNKKVYFGQNALHNDSGILSVGDQVQVLRSGLNQPPL